MFSKSLEEKRRELIDLIKDLPDPAARVVAGNIIRIICDVAFAEGQMSVLRQAQNMINQWPIRTGQLKLKD